MKQDPRDVERDAWIKALFVKLPTFDPTWTDDVQAKWHHAFAAIRAKLDAISGAV